jgi:hypothetical protein
MLMSQLPVMTSHCNTLICKAASNHAVCCCCAAPTRKRRTTSDLLDPALTHTHSLSLGDGLHCTTLLPMAALPPAVPYCNAARTPVLRPLLRPHFLCRKTFQTLIYGPYGGTKHLYCYLVGLVNEQRTILLYNLLLFLLFYFTNKMSCVYLFHKHLHAPEGYSQ